jgi:murein DD-endopeptidase MepM/ murein hydrolase activator NlpD/LAS superfamily LD-carboxypeptidase LdcB
MENNGILKSFDLQDDLNPKIWKKNSKGSYILSSEVREKLLEIAYEFIESLKVDIVVSDVHLTGSLVNFNWSKYSDFDLHIMADFNQFPKKSLSLYEELFKLKKTIFNSEQNIKIYGYDVEVFVQDDNEKGHSAGIFSLISNDWVQKPKKEKFELDKTILNKKIEQWKDKIDDVLESAKDEKDFQKSKKLISNLKEKLKDYRKIGLEKGGEMSYENLVFKYLRRSGHIEKLFNFKKERLDKELSLNEQDGKKDIISKLKKILKIDKDNGQKIDDPKKADVVDADVQELYNNLESIDKDVNQQSIGEYSYQKNVESIQIALELLGYDLPKFGVDGLYGPETASAVEAFKTDNLGKLDSETEKSEFVDTESSTISPPVLPLRITSGFGPRWGRNHQGIDIGVSSGTEIKAPASGEVMHAKFGSKNCGGIIWIKHADGYETKYCHCKQINVSPGQKIKKGQIIGLTGGGKGDKGAGNSTGPHLHFEVIQNGKHLNPENVIDKKNIGKYESLSVTNSTATLQTINILISKLKSKGITSDDLKPFVDISNTKPIKISEGELSNSKDIIDFLKEKGLSDEQASGIAGNLFIESRFKTDALGDNGTSFGLAQWHADRWDNLKEFVRDNDYDINSMNGQLEFLWYELKNKYSSVLDELRKTYTPADSATVFASKYERPASKNYSKRVQSAENLYEKYTGKKIINKDTDALSNEFTSRNDLPPDIQSAIKDLEKELSTKITNNQLKLEFSQEGNWRVDAGSVDTEAKKNIIRLISDAKKQFGNKITNGIISGYRSYDDQVRNFANKVKSGRSISNVQSVTTIPGFSEHHTGKAFDIFSVEPSWWDSNPEIKKWVAQNSKKYGFDVTYKKQGSLRIAEPWHLFYVGNQSQSA